MSAHFPNSSEVGLALPKVLPYQCLDGFEVAMGEAFEQEWLRKPSEGSEMLPQAKVK
jgi:hypothetical protein